MKSDRLKYWIFGVVIFIFIKFFEYLGVERGIINKILIFSGITVFTSALLFFLIKSIFLDKRMKKIDARINEKLKELERITKE